MISELEAAAADSVGGFFSRKPTHALPLGTPCPNCATPLEGPWCHACGQKGEEFHRSIGHLIAEAVEGLTHFDGRLWQTLPDLFRHPARLTRSYLDGHRAPQVPPFRLFLIVVVLVFFAGGLNQNTQTRVDMPKPGQKVLVTPGAKLSIQQDDMEAAKRRGPFQRWVIEHGQAAMKDPAAYDRAFHDWSHRLAILALPMAAGLLGLLFMFPRRRFYLFDHLIFSMHSLSFMGLLLSLSSALAAVIGGWSQLLLWAIPVHLFFHMRGVYGSGVVATLARMVALLIGGVFAGGIIVVIVALLGLTAMGAH
ncbi:hypothetical protein QO010_000568 [Caulobacter ginsengisoli]|uniref:DUF3667 domain-containing protein n=1 Tax=Caulobacter ginsengisoli TaxID=400775 RepID=A0ABU0ILC7_9CAUL|nr:DUF3667 domain-containing protein [Caulobacter ginsengisoli]MDQ0462820.1 hypothetical protein [Caulobacter ginsengisoli]